MPDKVLKKMKEFIAGCYLEPDKIATTENLISEDEEDEI